MFSMFNINYRSGEPIYQQIYNEVVKEISLGLLRPQEKIAAVRELAATLGISSIAISPLYDRYDHSIAHLLIPHNAYIVGNKNILTYTNIK